MLTPMSNLDRGASGIIKAIWHKGNMRRRLIDIGFNVGERVTLIARAPLGDPIAFLIKGSQIALRGSDAALITVFTEDNNGTDSEQRRQGHF